jgi:hypothetical protein
MGHCHDETSRDDGVGAQIITCFSIHHSDVPWEFGNIIWDFPRRLWAKEAKKQEPPLCFVCCLIPKTEIKQGELVE